MCATATRTATPTTCRPPERARPDRQRRTPIAAACRPGPPGHLRAVAAAAARFCVGPMLLWERLAGVLRGARLFLEQLVIDAVLLRPGQPHHVGGADGVGAQLPLAVRLLQQGDVVEIGRAHV